MFPSRAGVALVGWLLAMPSSLVWAGAPGGDDARSYLDKATSAYGLGRYAVAAENFEKAYELKPDLALLYNAAQSHRLAGNKQRAPVRDPPGVRQEGQAQDPGAQPISDRRTPRELR